MNKYAKAKIYKLVDIATGDVLYVGSTLSTLKHRWQIHRAHFDHGFTRPLYDNLRGQGKTIQDTQIELITLFPCNSKYELHSKERDIIKEVKPKWNKQVPTRTAAEWEIDNRVRRRLYKREWERRNKDRRNARRRELRKLKKAK